MYKIGAITLDTSHPLAFAEILRDNPRGRYTAVYNDGFRERDELEAFAKRFNLKICGTLEELIECVDIGFIHNCNWDKHLAVVETFAKAGKPVFVDKPIAGNVQDLNRFLELDRSGAEIVGTSAMRYHPDVDRIRREVAEAGGQIIHVNAAIGLGEFDYAIHAVETICGLIQDKPLSCQYIGTGTAAGHSCHSYFIRFAGGATAIYHNLPSKYVNSQIMVLSAGGNVTCEQDYSLTLGPGGYAAMLECVLDVLDGKRNWMATVESMVDAVTILLAGKASKNLGGSEISLDSSAVAAIQYDGDAFEKSYAASAGKLYLV